MMTTMTIKDFNIAARADRGNATSPARRGAITGGAPVLQHGVDAIATYMKK